MTDAERELIVRRLFDRGLLPWEGVEFDVATVLEMTQRERQVLKEEMEREAAEAQRRAEAALRMAPPGAISRFELLKIWLRLRWSSLRMAWAKKKGARAK